MAYEDYEEARWRNRIGHVGRFEYYHDSKVHLESLCNVYALSLSCSVAIGLAFGIIGVALLNMLSPLVAGFWVGICSAYFFYGPWIESRQPGNEGRIFVLPITCAILGVTIIALMTFGIHATPYQVMEEVTKYHLTFF